MLGPEDRVELVGTVSRSYVPPDKVADGRHVSAERGRAATRRAAAHIHAEQG
ncbi:hypothetical protein [Nonomuraea dietziae]|uniref:hypothetical protein n=1 Tax=Nonomuraea dietziae TaxID=65515 RepID=UPI0031DA1279